MSCVVAEIMAVWKKSDSWWLSEHLLFC